MLSADPVRLWPRWPTFTSAVHTSMIGRHCGQPTGQLPTSCCSLVPVAMNSGQDAHQDLPDDAAEDVTDDSDSEGGQAEDDDSDSGLLQRSQEAIDEARDAARDALKETLPDDEDP